MPALNTDATDAGALDAGTLDAGILDAGALNRDRLNPDELLICSATLKGYSLRSINLFQIYICVGRNSSTRKLMPNTKH